MKDKHETLSHIGIQKKSTLRNIHNNGGVGGWVGGISSCAVLLHSVISDKYQKDDQR
jgi:hypothetical protein